MSDKIKGQSIPKDGQVMLAIIKEMGMTDYDPKTVIMLTEFAYKYATTVLTEARYFANNRKKKFVDVEDVQASLHVLDDRAFVPTPPREISIDLVKAINSTPLPPIKPQCGLRLPPQGITLNNTNYALTKPVRNGLSEAVQPTMSLIKPNPIITRRITTNSSAVAQSQSVMVPPVTISLVPKLKIKLPTTNGILKRKRQAE